MHGEKLLSYPSSISIESDVVYVTECDRCHQVSAMMMDNSKVPGM